MQAFGLFPLGDQAVVGRIDLIVGLEHGPGEGIDKLVAVAQALPNLCPRRAALIPLLDTFLAWAQATERKLAATMYLILQTEIE